MSPPHLPAFNNPDLAEMIVSKTKIAEQATQAAQQGRSLGDACPYPFGTPAGEYFCEVYRQQAMQTTGRAAMTTTLWAIHIPGPDDLHAAPSKEAAEHMVAMHNKAMQEHLAKTQRTQYLDMVTAHVTPWLGDAASHAAALLEFDYAAWGLKGNTP